MSAKPVTATELPPENDAVTIGARAGLLNRICAYPFRIVWIMGAMMLDAYAIYVLMEQGLGWAELLSPSVVFWLVVALVPSSIIGLWPGALLFGWLVYSLCRKFNGAPYAIGEEVQVLVGPFRGQVTRINEIAKGQGGQTLLRVQLGPEARAKYKDMFDEYEVLRQ
jgi:hypothetical protein